MLQICESSLSAELRDFVQHPPPETPHEEVQILEPTELLREALLEFLEGNGSLKFRKGLSVTANDMDVRVYVHPRQKVPLFLVGKLEDIEPLIVRDEFVGDLVRVKPFDKGVTVILDEQGEEKRSAFFGNDSSIGLVQLKYEGQRHQGTVGRFSQSDTTYDAVPSFTVLFLDFALQQEGDFLHAINVYLDPLMAQ